MSLIDDKEGSHKKKVPVFILSWLKVSTSVFVGSRDDRTDRYLAILAVILSIICEV